MVVVREEEEFAIFVAVAEITKIIIEIVIIAEVSKIKMVSFFEIL